MDRKTGRGDSGIDPRIAGADRFVDP